MKLLAVETATDCLSVAILEGTLDHAQVLARIDEQVPGKHARHLIPAIDRMLKSSGLALADLDGFAVSIGPGSFTGLRVGLATVMGFRTVTGLPLVAVPTLEAMAWNLRGADQLLCPVLKARPGDLYWAFFRWTSEGALQRIEDEHVGSLASFASSLSELSEDTVVPYGPGWTAHRDAVTALLEPRRWVIQEAPPDAMAASAVSVGLAGLNRFARGEVAGLGLSPRYVQRAEAEIVYEQRARRGAPARCTDGQ